MKIENLRKVWTFTVTGKRMKGLRAAYSPPLPASPPKGWSQGFEQPHGTVQALKLLYNWNLFTGKNKDRVIKQLVTQRLVNAWLLP